jgi:MFS family permease
LSWRSRVQLLSLVTAVAAGAYARTALSPLQESLKAALSLNDNQMALLQGPAMALPLLLTAVPLGLAIDRYSRVRLIVALAVLNTAASATTALISSFALLFMARCVVGAVGFAMLPIALSLLSDLFPPDQRGRATTIVSVSQLGGSSAAFALGGVLLSLSGSGVDAWRQAMLWLAAPLILVVILTCGMREPARTGQSTQNPSVSRAWRELWDYRRTIAPLMFGMAMLETGLGGALIWSAPMLSRRFALAPDRVGAIMAMALLVSGAAGPILGGVVADLCQRFGGPGRITAVLSILAFLTVPLALFAITPAAVPAAAVLVLFMTLIAASVVMATTLFTTIVPNELRGLCVSVSVAVNVLFAIGVAPPIVSALSGAIGGPATIGKALSLVCLCTSLLAGAAFSVGRRYISRAMVQ